MMKYITEMKNMKETIFVWLLAPVVFLITRNPLTGPWRLIFVILTLIWLLVDGMLWARENVKRKLLDILVFGLFLVGATNWFFSPFFFALYLLIIGVTFVFTPLAGLGFVVSLVILFVFNVGEVDVAYDSLVLLSLLATFPIAMYLRKEYLVLEESRKAILVLEKQAAAAKTTVERLLSNVVTSTSAELRQPLVNIKNYTHMLMKSDVAGKKAAEYLDRIYRSSIVALEELNKFDEESTGRKIRSGE